jgi:hypothetical protein
MKVETLGGRGERRRRRRRRRRRSWKRGECLTKLKGRSEKWQKQTDQILKPIMTKIYLMMNQKKRAYSLDWQEHHHNMLRKKKIKRGDDD